MYKRVDVLATKADLDAHILKLQKCIKAAHQQMSRRWNSLYTAMGESALHELSVLEEVRRVWLKRQHTDVMFRRC